MPRSYRRPTSRVPRPGKGVAQNLGDVIPICISNVHITGHYVDKGFLVSVDDERCKVNSVEFDLLLEMALAVFSPPKSRYVHWWSKEYSCRTHNGLRQIAKRLRMQLRCDALICNNGFGGYGLAVNPSQIQFCDTLWALSSHHVSDRLLIALKSAYEQFRTAHPVIQSASIISPTGDVAQTSRFSLLAANSIDVST